MRKDLEAHVRGVLNTFGIRMAPIQRSNLRGGFRDQLSRAGQSDLAIELMADAFNPIHRSLCAAAEAIDDELREIARGSDRANRLMTVSCVGPVVALAYIATLFNGIEKFERNPLASRINLVHSMNMLR